MKTTALEGVTSSKTAKNNWVIEPQAFNDFTGFETGLNGWVIEPGSNNAVIITLPDEVFLYGNNFYQHDGIVMSKQYTGLVPNQRYRVSFKARKSENIPGNAQSIPRLQVSVGGVVIIEPQPIAHTSWAVHQGEFTATSETAKVDFKSVINGPTQGFGNYHVDDIRFGDQVADLTDFEDYDFNGWVKGSPVADTARIEAGTDNHGLVLRFPTHGDRGNDGEVLSKVFFGLTEGNRYTFSLDIFRENRVNPIPVLSLTASGETLGDLFSPVERTWTSHSRTFVAASSTVTLGIVSHEPEGLGNDYSLDNIRLVEEIPATHQ